MTPSSTRNVLAKFSPALYLVILGVHPSRSLPLNRLTQPFLPLASRSCPRASSRAGQNKAEGQRYYHRGRGSDEGETVLGHGRSLLAGIRIGRVCCVACLPATRAD